MKRRYSVSTAASTPPRMAIGIIGSMVQLISECLVQITGRENKIQFDSRTFSSQKEMGWKKRAEGKRMAEIWNAGEEDLEQGTKGAGYWTLPLNMS